MRSIETLKLPRREVNSQIEPRTSNIQRWSKSLALIMAALAIGATGCRAPKPSPSPSPDYSKSKCEVILYTDPPNPDIRGALHLYKGDDPKDKDTPFLELCEQTGGINNPLREIFINKDRNPPPEPLLACGDFSYGFKSYPDHVIFRETFRHPASHRSGTSTHRIGYDLIIEQDLGRDPDLCANPDLDPSKRIYQEGDEICVRGSKLVFLPQDKSGGDGRAAGIYPSGRC